MRTAAFAALACVLLLEPARADSQDFTGNWANPEHDASGIAQVVISPAGGDRLGVRIYGDCHPTECDWGAQEARIYSASLHAGEAPESLAVHYHTSFAEKDIVLHLARQGELIFELRTEFHDGSNRHDFAMTGRLSRSAWAGPVGRSWDRMPQVATGWGGGARSGASPPPAETCTVFDPRAVRVVETGNGARLETPGVVLAQGVTRDIQRAQDVIRHYRFDRFCKTAGAPFWKRGGDIPGDAMGGADCIFFNPTTAHDVRMSHVWKVVDGTQWLADAGQDKARADAVLALIRFYRLGRECFVGGRIVPVMTYWLTH
jgi:hypothetical protein